MKRWLFLAYGVAGHATFLVMYLYMVGFVGNLVVPRTIDAPVGSPMGAALAINLLLVAIFALQHSVMARPAFKRYWTRLVPQPIERATYVWLANAATILLMWQWRPMDAIVWHAEHPALRGLLWLLFAVGWLAVPLVSLLINHFDLFGTRQVWLFWRNQPYTNLPFRTPAAYGWIRHPLYVAWGFAFWAIPTMTVGHLLFATSLTCYMLAAAVIEERDLVQHFGKQYEEYRQRVPMFIPRWCMKSPVATAFSEPQTVAEIGE